MSPHPNIVDNHNDFTAKPEDTNASSDYLLTILLPVLLGAVLIYGAGFASNTGIHNAAHDARHSAGFPCH